MIVSLSIGWVWDLYQLIGVFSSRLRRQFCCKRLPPERDGGMWEVQRAGSQAEEHAGSYQPLLSLSHVYYLFSSMTMNPTRVSCMNSLFWLKLINKIVTVPRFPSNDNLESVERHFKTDFKAFLKSKGKKMDSIKVKEVFDLFWKRGFFNSFLFDG